MKEKSKGNHAYKIVTVDDHGRLRPLTGVAPEGFRYEQGEWTYSPLGHGPLAAYTSLIKALAGLARMYEDAAHMLTLLVQKRVSIWECTYEPWRGQLMEDEIAIRPLWTPEWSLPIQMLPEGTILCNAIRLDKEVSLSLIAEFLVPAVHYEVINGRPYVEPCIAVNGAWTHIPIVHGTYIRGVDSPVRAYVRRFLAELRNGAPRMARVVRQALLVADDLIAARNLAQQPFLK
jgi:hypothetical protein